MKKIFGFITFSIGVMIIGWVIFNLFSPQKEFQIRSFLQFIFPILFIVYGYKWMKE